MATTYKDIIKDIHNDKHDIIKIYPAGLTSRAICDYYGVSRKSASKVMSVILDDGWDLSVHSSSSQGGFLHNCLWPKNIPKGLNFGFRPHTNEARFILAADKILSSGRDYITSDDVFLNEDIEFYDFKNRWNRMIDKGIISADKINRFKWSNGKYKFKLNVHPDDINPYMFSDIGIKSKGE